MPPRDLGRGHPNGECRQQLSRVRLTVMSIKMWSQSTPHGLAQVRQATITAKNNTTSPLYDVEQVTSFYDAGNHLLDTNTAGGSLVDVVNPGETVPVYMEAPTREQGRGPLRHRVGCLGQDRPQVRFQAGHLRPARH